VVNLLKRPKTSRRLRPPRQSLNSVACLLAHALWRGHSAGGSALPWRNMIVLEQAGLRPAEYHAIYPDRYARQRKRPGSRRWKKPAPSQRPADDASPARVSKRRSLIWHTCLKRLAIVPAAEASSPQCDTSGFGTGTGRAEILGRDASATKSNVCWTQRACVEASDRAGRTARTLQSALDGTIVCLPKAQPFEPRIAALQENGIPGHPACA